MEQSKLISLHESRAPLFDISDRFPVSNYLLKLLVLLGMSIYSTYICVKNRLPFQANKLLERAIS